MFKPFFLALALLLSGFFTPLTATESFHQKNTLLTQSTEYPAEPRSDTFDNKDKTGSDYQGYDVEETDFV